MNVGHVLLQPGSDDALLNVVTLIESLDRLAVRQFVLLADSAASRRLRACPYVQVGQTVRSPVVANCLMGDVDVVHAHDTKSGQVGLLLTLTRSIPFVLTERRDGPQASGAVNEMVRRRARAILDASATDAERLIDIYRQVADGVAPVSELPEHADRRQ